MAALMSDPIDFMNVKLDVEDAFRSGLWAFLGSGVLIYRQFRIPARISRSKSSENSSIDEGTSDSLVPENAATVGQPFFLNKRRYQKVRWDPLSLLSLFLS